MTKPNDPKANEQPGRAPKPEAAAPRDSNAPVEESKTIPPNLKPGPYVFKIVKADPKNTLNFEDVADK